MTGSTTRIRLALVAFSAALLAGAAAAQAPLVVGAAVSQTGPHADLALDYGRGIQLWRDEVNAAGGLLGRRVELRLLDDGSNAARARGLYAQLIREGADALIGPYGTAATMVAAAEAETAQRVLINGAGWSRTVHKRSPKHVFQTAVPYSAYGTAVIDLARAAGIRSTVVLARSDPPSSEMAAAALDAAKRAGIPAAEVQSYPGSTEDFVPLVNSARASGAEAWIVFGELRDAAEMIKALERLGHAPRLFFVRAVAEPGLIDLVGQAAEHAMGALAYDPRAATSGNPRFVQAFAAKWSRPPGAAAAEGYAAARVLAEGIRRAGTAQPQKLRAALASLRTATVLGEYRVDPATGEQLAATPLVVQIQLGKREIVWPESLATAKPVLPYPPWSERQLLK